MTHQPPMGDGRTPSPWVSGTADFLERAINVLLAVMLAVLVVCLCYQSFGRYVLDDAPSWTEEVSRFLVVYITMLGAAVIVRHNGHVAVTVLIHALPNWIGAPLTWVRDAVVLSCAGILVWYGYGLANIANHRLSPALEISMFWPFIAIPISGVLIALFLAVWRIEHGSDVEAHEETI